MKTRFLIPIFFTIMTASAQNKVNLLVGTYTNSCDSKGIYVYEFDTATADVKLKATSDKIINPSYLTVSPDRKKVWAVNEDGAKSGVTSFAFDAKKGTLKTLNSQETLGADPCFIMNDKGNVITANYSGGSISVFKNQPDGKLDKACQIVTHEGHSMRKQQKSPHMHQTQLAPDKKFVIANDLGTDRIYVYRYYPESEKQVLEFQDTIPVKTASGPRHLTFSPDGKSAYLLQELDGTLTAYHYAEGKFSRFQETTVVNPDSKSDASAADIHISQDGKFLYATNRGDANTITTFSVGTNGRLSLIETIATGGKGPRNFTLSPDGNFVLVAHQYSNDVIIFKRDKLTGKLTDSGKKIALCSPVCLVFAPQD
ncbi:lactonase family protein [Flavobacterium silvaticum]|uniref:Lactonase family protein n=1 Tax=Flavobacterium silvaticum TaxID=1852020 RepID=A0A972FIX6_9FLAO|nr:lactonase family protein [Flavobacterium silvaticum]NMH26806.1 lactonase family protein [Flavobacterium silvaticum]